MQYFVIDPCYLSQQLRLKHDEEYERNVWGTFVDKLENEDGKAAAAYLSEQLGFKIIDVCRTGYGDWENRMVSDTPDVDNLLDAYFYADAGMFCVAEKPNSEQVKALMGTEKRFFVMSGAEFESDQEPQVEFHYDPDWSTVDIRGTFQGKPYHLRSMNEEEADHYLM